MRFTGLSTFLTFLVIMRDLGYKPKSFTIDKVKDIVKERFPSKIANYVATIEYEGRRLAIVFREAHEGDFMYSFEMEK